MPFMGGMEATQIIRQYEEYNRLPRIPIIALTAHASTFYRAFSVYTLDAHNAFTVIGDRERCLDAGMDDHITSTFPFFLASSIRFVC
jgi:osomolarity two-component system, sensor histidine kinase NIK1